MDETRSDAVLLGLLVAGIRARREKEAAEGEPDPEHDKLHHRDSTAADEDPDHPERLTYVLHNRGGEDLLKMCLELAESEDAAEREAAMDVLAQLGVGKEDPPSEACLPALRRALADADLWVQTSAIYGLGHRFDPALETMERLLPRVEHPNTHMREAVLHALASCFWSHRDPRVIRSLITLSRDIDADTRNWATFFLHSYHEEVKADIPALIPEICDALRARLSEPFAEIRGEALVGLARYGAPDIQSFIEAEIHHSDGDFTTDIFNAMSLAWDPRHVPWLEAIWDDREEDWSPYFVKALRERLERARALLASGADAYPDPYN